MWSLKQYRDIGNDVRKRQQTNCLHHPPADDSDDDTTSLLNHPRNDRIIVKPRNGDDPINPKNWSRRSRTKNIAILALLIAAQAWSGAAESMANSEASKQFGVSKTAENASTGAYLFGVGAGCLFVGPLSETLGRNPTYLVSTFVYLLFVMGTALVKTFNGQIACRFFVGFFASATLGINGSSVRDQFRPVKRAFVFPLIGWANIVPPVLAPIVGGWIVQNPNLHWQWTEWITLIISVTAFLVAFLFLPETYLPVLLDWKAKHFRNVTGDPKYVSRHSEEGGFLARLKNILPMPVKFFFGEPVVTVLGSYLVFLYILLYTFLSGFDYIFKETYQLSSGLTGSCFGAIAAGATAFTLCAPGLYTWARHRTEYQRGAKIQPEFRLWPAIVASPLLPVSLFWLGWTNDPDISIWSGLAACFVFGIVLIAMYVASYEYIIDIYGDHASIALASITMVRYLLAGGMVMAARPMYEGIGVKWTMTLLGAIGVVLMPGPLLLHQYGPRLRGKSDYAMTEVG